MTLIVKSKICEFTGLDDFQEKMDVSTQEMEEATDTDMEELIGQWTVRPIVEAVLDERSENFTLTRINDLDPHFEICRVRENS